MSELIVQMEPPKLCFECFFRLDCELYMNEVMKPFGKRDFTAFKPLVNGCLIHGVLPEQHGDLIDRDKLLKDIEMYHVSDGCFQHWVELQDAIITAERSET